MQADSLKSLIDNNLAKIVLAGMRGVYPGDFRSGPAFHREYSLTCPIVSHQLVFTETMQILSFFVMDPRSFVKAGENLFPKMPRNESLKLVVSANAEILNSTSSKFGFILGKMEGRTDVVITPPLIMNFSGEGRLPLTCEDTLFWTFQSQDLAFDFIITVQKV
jgi:hypothetical protein